MKIYFFIFIPVLFGAYISFSFGFPSFEERPGLADAYVYFYGRDDAQFRYEQHQKASRHSLIDDLRNKAQMANENGQPQGEILIRYIQILSVFPAENGLDDEDFQRLYTLLDGNLQEF